MRILAAADVMSSRNRFNKLNQYFHLHNNTNAVPMGQPEYDPLFKVRPLLDTVLCNSKAHATMDNISIDEAMIKFSSRLRFKHPE